MKAYISKQMQEFLQPRVVKGVEVEEALDQPLYHIQSYGTAGSAAEFVFFNSTSTDLSVTNVTGSELSKGRRFAIFGLSVAFFGGTPTVQDDTGTTVKSYLEDARKVLESAAVLKLRILEKDYLIESPLTRVPAGQGLYSGGAAIQRTQASAADGTRGVGYASNGAPMIMNTRKLRVPIPLPEQTTFKVGITYSAAQTIATASSLGVYLDGVTLRALQ